MAQSIDINKHLRDSLYAALQQIHDPDTAAMIMTLLTIWTPNPGLSYRDLHFAGAINYRLDEWNPSPVMDTIDTVSDSNPSQTETTLFIIRRREEISNSYTWSTEHAISVGIEVSISIKVPLVGGIDTSISTEYSFSRTESTTETRTRTWEIEKQIPVPPRTKITAVVMIEKTVPRIPFEMVGEFSGSVIALSGGSFSTSIPIWAFFQARPLANFRVEGNKVTFRTAGIFTASEGINIIINGTEQPLDPQADQAPRHWSLKITPEEPAPIPQEEIAIDPRSFEEAKEKLLADPKLSEELKRMLKATSQRFTRN